MPRWRDDLTGISTRKPECTLVSLRIVAIVMIRTLQVDDNTEHQNGRQQIHDVGQVLTIEGLSQRHLLVWPGEEQVDQSNDRALELRTSAGVDRRRRESTPDNGLADVCRNEQADATAQSVALLQQLIKKDDNQRRG